MSWWPLQLPQVPGSRPSIRCTHTRRLISRGVGICWLPRGNPLEVPVFSGKAGISAEWLVRAIQPGICLVGVLSQVSLPCPSSLPGVAISEQNGWKRIHGFQQCHVRPCSGLSEHIGWCFYTWDRGRDERILGRNSRGTLTSQLPLSPFIDICLLCEVICSVSN